MEKEKMETPAVFDFENAENVKFGKTLSEKEEEIRKNCGKLIDRERDRADKEFDRAEELAKELTELKAKKAKSRHDDLAKAICELSGLPAEYAKYLRGNDAHELAQDALHLLDLAGRTPTALTVAPLANLDEHPLLPEEKAWRELVKYISR